MNLMSLESVVITRGGGAPAQRSLPSSLGLGGFGAGSRAARARPAAVRATTFGTVHGMMARTGETGRRRLLRPGWYGRNFGTDPTLASHDALLAYLRIQLVSRPDGRLEN